MASLGALLDSRPVRMGMNFLATQNYNRRNRWSTFANLLLGKKVQGGYDDAVGEIGGLAQDAQNQSNSGYSALLSGDGASGTVQPTAPPSPAVPATQPQTGAQDRLAMGKKAFVAGMLNPVQLPGGRFARLALGKMVFPGLEKAAAEERAANEQAKPAATPPPVAAPAKNAQASTDAGLIGQYKAVHARVMDQFKNLGAAEHRAIDEQFKQSAATSKQSMTSRGLSGSTVAQTMRQGIERKQREAHEAVDAKLADYKAKWDHLLTKDRLTAEERIALQQITSNERLIMQQLGSTTQLRLGQMGALNGTQIGYPDAGLLANTIQANEDAWMSRKQLEAQKDAGGFQWESLIPLGSSAIGTAGNVWAAKTIAMTCLAGDTPILTATGPKLLRDVAIGDRVATWFSYEKVIAKDFGRPHAANNEFIKITTKDSAIVLTNTHYIDGKPAGEFGIGDYLYTGKAVSTDIVEIEPVGDVREAGDLRLEGDVPYVAGEGVGIVVESMLSPAHAEKAVAGGKK